MPILHHQTRCRYLLIHRELCKSWHPLNYSTRAFHSGLSSQRHSNAFQNKIQKELQHHSPLEITVLLVYNKKTDYMFVDTLKDLVRQIIENKRHFCAAMIFPHLILPRTKNSIDGFVNKTISRHLKMWSQSQVDELFSESKALQLWPPIASKNNRINCTTSTVPCTLVRSSTLSGSGVLSLI